MKMKQLLKAGFSILLASAMMITSVPATGQAAEVEPLAGETPILDSALANYDFGQYETNAEGNLVNGDSVITLEEFGSCKKPELANDTKRGQVLALKEQGVTDNGVEQRGDALLANPFAGQSVANGLTLNFWTKTTGTAGKGKCLIDFEVGPAETATADTKRAATFAINQQMVYYNARAHAGDKYTDFGVGKLGLTKDNGWKMVTMAVTTEGITFYSDGQKISHSVDAGSEDYNRMINDLAGTGGICNAATAATDTKVRLGASMSTYWTGAGAYIDDISFYGKALSDAEVAALYRETLIPVPLESISISGDKTVDEDKTIQLSVKLTPADTTDDRTVTWTSSDEEVLTVDPNGKVFGVKGGTATVTASVAGKTATADITVNGIDFTEELPAGYYLTVYSTKKDFYASTGNLAQETRSVYMAVSKDGKTFDVLNNNGGVIFAKNGSKQITDPQVYKSGSDFVVIAPDTTASKGYHTFTSEDGVHYYNQSLASAAGDYGTENPLKRSKFPLMYKGQNILETDDTITLGNACELTEAEYTYIVNKLGTVVNTGLETKTFPAVTAKAGDDIAKLLTQKYPSVNATYSDGSTQKFNIDWSEATKGKDLSMGGTFTLQGKVQQTKYLNNLKRINNSTLLEDDPTNLNPDEPDHYNEATGEVYYDDTKFVEGMADPNIYYDELTGYYYMTGSYFPQEGDDLPGEELDLSATSKDQYSRVVLRRGRTLEELQDRSKQKVIWKVGNQGFENAQGTDVAKGARYIWAPEIHRVGNYWVVYFTESHASNDLFNIYCHALVLDGAKDPYETALKAADGVSEWKDYQMRGGTGLTKAITSSFCLDMTYFEDGANGDSYVIWAAKGYDNTSKLYMARVKQDEPWVLDSEIILLTTPEYGWENVRYVVNEGPTVLQRDGKIYMCYSASGTGSEYAIGMMSADQGEDLLDIANWTKSPYPLLTSRDVEGEEGPGHNSFTVDQDGNAIFVYHARPTSHNYKHCGWDGKNSLHYNSEPLNDPCRHARLKRVHWAADGTPILKMTYAEELTEENQTVSVKVTIPAVTPTLSKSTLGLETGKSATLTVSPSNVRVTWSTSNPSVATVVNGKVTAGKKTGTATITATASNGKKVTCTVTVVSLSKTKLTMKIGESATLKVNGTKKKVTWSSSKKANVAVSSKGKVTAKKAGKVTITAKAEGVNLKCTVTVKKAPTKVKATVGGKTKVTLKKNKTCKIKVSMSPKGSDSVLKYSTSKKKVATVDSKGKIKAKKKGTATITVKAANGKKATIKVTVK